jgi:hypothetical protein
MSESGSSVQSVRSLHSPAIHHSGIAMVPGDINGSEGHSPPLASAISLCTIWVWAISSENDVWKLEMIDYRFKGNGWRAVSPWDKAHEKIVNEISGLKR